MPSEVGLVARDGSGGSSSDLDLGTCPWNYEEWVQAAISGISSGLYKSYSAIARAQGEDSVCLRRQLTLAHLSLPPQYYLAHALQQIHSSGPGPSDILTSSTYTYNQPNSSSFDTYSTLIPSIISVHVLILLVMQNKILY